MVQTGPGACQFSIHWVRLEVKRPGSEPDYSLIPGAVVKHEHSYNFTDGLAYELNVVHISCI